MTVDNFRDLPKLKSDFAFDKISNSYISNKKLGDFDKGSSWRILTNLSKREIFTTYLSSKLLKVIFPDSPIYDVMFSIRKNGDLALLRRSGIEYKLFRKDDCVSGDIPFDCLKGGCDFNLDKNTTNGNVHSLSKFMSKEIIDFEKAYLSTLLLDTNKVRCEDFALRDKSGFIVVRQVNLAENFLTLTKTHSLTNELLSIKVRDQDYAVEESYLQLLEAFETNVFLKLFRNVPGSFANKVDVSRLLSAINSICAKENALGIGVLDIMWEVKEFFGEKLLNELSFSHSQFYKYRNKEMNFQNLKAFLIKQLDTNLKNLKKLALCVEIEQNLIENNKEALVQSLQDELVAENPLCLSLFRSPAQKTLIDIRQLTLSEMAKTYKYQNEAGDLFNSFWRGELVLPHVEPDSLRDEL